MDIFKATEFYTFIVRWIFPILAVMIFSRCLMPLLQKDKRNTVWGYLEIPNTLKMPIKHWENSIGRSKLSDIVINLPFISRSHAVLTFCEGIWSIADLGSKGGVEVNGEKIYKSQNVNEGDTISLSGVGFKLLSAETESFGNPQQTALTGRRSTNSKDTSGISLLLIAIFQILGSFQIYLSLDEKLNSTIPLTFLLFISAEFLYCLIMWRYSRKYFELELLAFFLCGLSLLVVAAAAPDSLYKQLAAIIIGMVIFSVLVKILENLEQAQKLKYVLTAGAILLLILNLAIGETRFGAKNWINLGFITFQPLEFVKVAFVLAGTATLDKLLTRRNLTAFIAFSGACIGALCLMRDLGTAVIFFGAFLVIAFMRSGDVRTIALISAGAILSAIAVVSFLPYIASRFAAWGHVWELASTSGYQQTRTMIAAASGGILGVGGGNGYLVDIPASDTDLVFGMLCEEWGLVVGLTAVLVIVFFAVYSVLLTERCKSSFYAVAACGAASIFLIQSALNIFGSLDLLPLTGVTLPFVSNGGSAMIASWGLLAFIKAADERRRLG